MTGLPTATVDRSRIGRFRSGTVQYSDLREEAVVGGGEPRRLTALVGCAPRPTVFAHAWAQTDLTIGHLVPGEGALTMMESADFKVWGFGPLTVVESLLRGRLRWAWMCCRCAKAARQTLWGTCVPLVARATSPLGCVADPVYLPLRVIQTIASGQNSPRIFKIPHIFKNFKKK